MNIHNVKFITSAATASGFLHDQLPKVAFAGKSNVGKSSVINRLLQRKNYARVGESPGKTVHVNYFLLDEKLYLVDLPGYGYAKVSRAEKERWAALMEDYFADPAQITFGVFIVDARHKPTENDVIMADWFKQTGAPFLVVANKLDKLRKSDIPGNLQQIAQTLGLSEDCILPFSAEKGDGREDLLQAICQAAGVE